MPKQTKTNLNTVVAAKLSRVFRFVLFLVALTGVFLYTRVSAPVPASAAVPSTLNFQARLLTGSGAIVPDGVYNVEFKLYNASSSSGSSQGSCTGDAACLWTETRLTTDAANLKVNVKSGYLSVYLGDKTAFGTIAWDQQLYLTMNIGGTAVSPTWDGEMTPRLRLTSVPYAQQAARATTLQQTTAGGGIGTVDFNSLTADRKYLFPDTTLATTASPGTVCVFNGATSNCPAATGSAFYIQNTTGSATPQLQANFNIQATNSTTNGTIGGIIRGAAGGQTVDLFQLQSSAGAVLSKFDANGYLSVGTSTSPTGGVATFNGNVGVGTTAPVATFHVQGQAAASGTGTISSSGTTVTSNGDNFGNLNVGDTITASGQTRIIASINTAASPDTLTTGTAFSPAISAGTSFTFQQPLQKLVDSSGTAQYLMSANGSAAIGTTPTVATRLIIQGTTTGSSVAGLDVQASDGSSRLYVRNDGNVGIGTTNPQNKLQIGTQSTLVTATPDTLSLGATVSNTAGQNPKLKVYDDGTNILGLGASSNQLDYIVNNTSSDHVFYAQGIELLRIKGFTGNVGIGQSNPTAKLHVLGSPQPAQQSGNGTAASTVLSVTGGQGGNTVGASGQVGGQGGGASITGGAGGNAPAGSTNGSGGSITLQGGAPGTGAGAAGTYGNIIMQSSGGNVGIGTASPTAQFQVAGGTTSSGATTMTASNAATTFTTSVSMTLNAGDYIIPTTTTGQARAVTVTATGTTFTVTPAFSAGVTAETFTIHRAITNLTNSSGTSALFVQGSTGNVGIGTTAPATPLSVIGVSTFSGNINQSSGNINTFNLLNFNSGNNSRLQLTNNGSIIDRNVADANVALIVQQANASSTGDILQVKNSASTVLSIQQNGSATFSGNVTLGASAGSGTLLTNNGATVNTTLALNNFATGGSIGSAATTVDIYTAISVAQTTAGQTLTLPAPTANTTYGRLLYISNIGTTSFTLLGTTLNAGSTATLIWSNTNGAASWQFAGADGSAILNQNAADQSANFRITGTGQANTSYISPLFKSLDSVGGGNSANVTFQSGDQVSGSGTSGSVTIKTGDATSGNRSSGNIGIDVGVKAGTGTAGTISIGTTNATALTIGRVGVTSTEQGNVTLGASAGSGTVLTNNGATVNTTLALGNFATGGAIGTAAATVDIYTSISIAQTTASQTLTIPTPAANTTYGRIVYISNIGTTGFTLLGSTLNAGATATLVWANTNGGAAWTYAGADGNAIVNQNSVNQTANFRITGTGQANGGFLSPSIDVAAAGTLSVGTGANNNAISLGRSGITTTNAGAFTSSQLLTGSLGLTVSGAAVSLNDSSNFNTTINTGSSTGSVTIGNTLAGALSLQTASTIGILSGTTGTAVNIGNTTSNPNIGFTGSGTFGTTTGTVSLNGSTQLAANKDFTINTGTGVFSQTFSGTTQTPYTLNSTFAPSGGGTQTNQSLIITNNPSSSANTLYGQAVSITQSSNLASAITGQRIRFTDAGTGTGTKIGLDIDVTTANASDTTYAAIFNGGNVGIGTSSPTAALHISTAGGGADLFKVTDTTATAQDVFKIADNGATTLRNQANSTAAFQIQSAAAGTDVLTVDTTNSQLSVRGTNSDASTSGSELVTSQDFTNATYWTCGATWTKTTTSAQHTSISTATCAATATNVAVTAGVVYQVSFRIAGNAVQLPVTPSIGGVNGTNAVYDGTYTQVITASTTGNLTFTPNAFFGGTIDQVSVKVLTYASAVLQVKNSSNAVALEVRAGSSTTNAFIGLQAGRSNTTGTNNTGFGTAALTGNITGTDNTAFGTNALKVNSTSLYNTAVGSGALQASVGDGNTAVGYNAGYTSTPANAIVNGTYNTFLGYNSGSSLANTASLANSTAIGAYAVVGSNNSLVLGCVTGTNGCPQSPNVGIGTATPTAALHTIATGAKVSAYTGNLLTNVATATGVFNKYGVEVQSTGTWSGGSNVGLYVSSVTGGLNNYDAIFNGGGNVGIGTISPSNKLTVDSANATVSTASTYALALNNGGINFTAGADATNVYLQSWASKPLQINNQGNNVILNANGGSVGIGTAATTPTGDLSFGGNSDRTIKLEINTGNAIGHNLTVAAGAAGAGASPFAGGQLNLQGGAAGGTGNANGGGVSISGGAGTGTGTLGLVSIASSAFSSSAVQTNSIAAGLIDSFGTIPVTANTTGVTVSVPDPAQSVIGRVIYITARDASNDFTLRLNAARTPIDIAMKANSTATLIWNGVNWTAAGASSSTDLQSAYNNTLTSAGGAELVLNASGGAADGLTIRNNATTPISGGILEVQSSIGTNLFSVNNFGTELAANGGSETSSTFATNWTAAPAGGTVTRTTTAGQFVTGLAGAQVATTTTANTGIRNNLSGNPVNTIGAVYQVSFTAKSTINGTPIDVVYSRDGGTTLTSCTNYGAAGAQNLSNTVWTKVTCTITIASATAATDPDLYIRKTDAVTAPTIYIDNLSFIRNDTTTQPSNVQVGGGINGGPVTLFTLDRASAPPVASGNTTYYGSMYYDTTTGRIQCYEADGWGACGSPPDNIITLTPEYTGAVLNGTGVGTLTADFCANSAALTVGTLCGVNNSRQFYRWTSPQATEQTYGLYVSYKLPNTFKTFYSDNTITLTALTDNTTNGSVTYEVFRSTGGAISRCYDSITNETAVTSIVNMWQTVPINGAETGCGFVGGDNIIFKINVKSKSNANVYVENLNFTYTNN